jgi:hypothetical protein
MSETTSIVMVLVAVATAEAATDAIARRCVKGGTST